MFIIIDTISIKRRIKKLVNEVLIFVALIAVAAILGLLGQINSPHSPHPTPPKTEVKRLMKAANKTEEGWPMFAVFVGLPVGLLAGASILRKKLRNRANEEQYGGKIFPPDPMGRWNSIKR